MMYGILSAALIVALAGCSSTTSTTPTHDSSVRELGHGPDLDVGTRPPDRSLSPDRAVSPDLTPHYDGGVVCEAGLCCSYTTHLVESAKGKSVGIALDSTGVAHICYDAKTSTSTTLKVATASTTAGGTTWSKQVVDTAGAVNYLLWGCAIATDKNDKLYVSYDKFSNFADRSLTLADNVGGNWRLTTIAPDTREWLGSSIAVDDLGRVHLARGGNTGPFTKVTRYVVASAFTAPTVQLSTPVEYAGERLSMVVDGTNKAHLVFMGSGGLMYTSPPDAAATLVEGSTDLGAITLDPSDTPVVVYHHHSYYDQLESKTKGNTNTWTKEAIVLDRPPSVIHPAMDAQGKLHLLYDQGTIGPAILRYITNVSGAWPTASKVLANATTASALAVDATGTAHVVYREADKVIYGQLKCQ